MVSGGDWSEVFPEDRGRYPGVKAHNGSTDVGSSGRRASDHGGAWSLTLGGRNVQGHADLAGGESSAGNRQSGERAPDSLDQSLPKIAGGCDFTGSRPEIAYVPRISNISKERNPVVGREMTRNLRSLMAGDLSGLRAP